MLVRHWVGEAGSGESACAATALGSVTFGSSDRDTACARLALNLPLDRLAPEPACVDVWRGAGNARDEQVGAVRLATDGSRLFGVIQVDENESGGLRAATAGAYAAIFAALEGGSCPYPLRFWNYVPRINEALDGLERYRHFNIGRQQAFLAARRAAFAGAPAACAIGTTASLLTIYFVAADQQPVAIENPRQVSAYHYPREYGPRSPTFSRASLAMQDEPMLFISGTASIVGHRSEHPGDPVAQTRETFVNLGTLVTGANARLARTGFALDRLTYTIYIRNPADLARVRAEFLAAVGQDSTAAHNAVFLRGDICRSELLVEIEAASRAAP